MRISVTERQTFKRCRRKWEYQSYNRQSLSPVINAPALELGTLVHATLAEWTDNPSKDPVAIYNQLSGEYFQTLIALYTERVGCAPSMQEMGPNAEAITLGQSMIANYQAKWHSPIPPGFTLVENELTLIQPVPGTEHCKCRRAGECDCDRVARPSVQCYYGYQDEDDCICRNDEPCSCRGMHELECTFDGLMQDEQGDYYIIERKTFSRTPTLDELNSNDQFLAYQWAANQVFGQDRVVGVAYDGLLKKPKPSGVHKSLDDLFLRRILLRNQSELAEMGQFLAAELNEMANPATPIYKTVPPVQGCQRWECSFLDLCKATSKGEPTEHILKMFVRSERKSHLDRAAEQAEQAAI